MGQLRCSTGLGDLEGRNFNSIGGVSADGSTVVGRGTSGNRTEAFVYTAGSGITGLGVLAGGSFLSTANGVSADGSTVVGQSGSANGPEAFVYTAGSGIAGLGDLAGGSFDSAAFGVSADGSTVVGRGTSANGQEAFVYTAGSGMTGLGDLEGGIFDSDAFGVSADGSTVVGRGNSANGFEAFVYTGRFRDDRPWGDLEGGNFNSIALDVSADGSTVVGRGNLSQRFSRRFVYTAGSGMTGLGDLEGGNFNSSAVGVSADGSTVVGRGESANGFEAFVYDAAEGIRSVRELLEELGQGDQLTGWTLDFPRGISADGLTIVGEGTNPDGNFEAWIAVIPEPTSALVMMVLGRGASRSPAGPVKAPHSTPKPLPHPWHHALGCFCMHSRIWKYGSAGFFLGADAPPTKGLL